MVKMCDYIEVKITQEMLDLAKVLSEKIPEDIKNSILDGKGRFIGCLGQAMLIYDLGAKHVDSFHFDVVLNNEEFEVKSKGCYQKPLAEYDATVFDSNTKQETKYYAFTRILKDYSKGWIIGYITPVEYFKKCRFVPKGTIDYKLLTKADGWNLKYEELIPFKKKQEAELLWNF